MRRYLEALPLVLSLAVVALASFTATAFAAGQVVPPNADATDLLRPVYEAFAHGQYIYAGCITIVLAVALVKRYGSKWKWVNTERGTAALAFAGALGASLGAKLADGGHLSGGLAWSSFKIAAGAAGGFFMFEHLVVEPLLKPLQARLPKWAQPLLGAGLWIFEHQLAPSDGEKAIATAEAAGTAAVETKPAEGVAAVLGQPTEVK